MENGFAKWDEDYKKIESSFVRINDLLIKYKLPNGVKINDKGKEYLGSLINKGWISGTFNGIGWWIITK